MIEMLKLIGGEKVFEIGVGSGYHASCLIESVEGKCEFYGVELNPDFYRFGLSNMEMMNYQSVVILQGNELNVIDLSLKYDRVYSASAMKEIPSHFNFLMNEGGLLQVIRPLSRKEFDIESSTAWVKKTYKNHQDYMSSDWNQKFACLSVYRLRNKRFRQIDVIYDVAFVPYHTSVYNYDEIATDQIFSDY